MTVAIGIGAYPRDGETIESLLEAADRALYQMKRSGGGVGTEESLSCTACTAENFFGFFFFAIAESVSAIRACDIIGLSGVKEAAGIPGR